MNWKNILIAGAGLLLAGRLSAQSRRPDAIGGLPALHGPGHRDSAFCQAKPAANEGTRYAIVVGLSDYKIYSSLPGAAPDALSVGNALTALGFPTPAVLACTNGVTLDKKDFVRKLRQIVKKCKKEDLLLLYFAGHGSNRESKDYLLMSDTIQQDNKPNVFKSSAFSLNDETDPDSLKRILESCQALRRVIIIDACRNTTQRDAAPLLPMDDKFHDRMDQVVRAAPAGNAVAGAVLYACSPSETSKEDIVKKAGVFTLPLVEALQGAAKDAKGQVTLGGVLAYVKKNILKRDGKPIQNPVLYGPGDLVLGLFEDANRAVVSRPNPVDGAEMVWIPSIAAFQSGTTDQEKQDLLENRSPEEQDALRPELEKESTLTKTAIPGFWIYRNLVTVGQFKKFINAMKAENKDISWPKNPDFSGYKNWSDDALPMVNASSQLAKQYAEWAGRESGKQTTGSLPTEAEWELAARGPQRRVYPWGDAFDSKLAHSSVGSDVEAKGPALPGQYKAGASPYGVYDMAGNLWQWCSNGAKYCLHGGSWKESDPLHLRSAYCNEEAERMQNDDVIGFRIVLHTPSPSGAAD